MFEDSEVHADIIGRVTNIKNPRTGRIVCDGVGSVTIDENIKAPANCEIIVRNK